jgi:aryl-alcohol dehydrogenase-like predicted oxidoreductase
MPACRGYGKEYGKEANLEAYKAIVSSGLTFIDTAEVSPKTLPGVEQ